MPLHDWTHILISPIACYSFSIVLFPHFHEGCQYFWSALYSPHFLNIVIFYSLSGLINFIINFCTQILLCFSMIIILSTFLLCVCVYMCMRVLKTSVLLLHSYSQKVGCELLRLLLFMSESGLCFRAGWNPRRCWRQRDAGLKNEIRHIPP